LDEDNTEHKCDALKLPLQETTEGDCCRVVWNDNYSTPTITIFIDRDLVYSEL